MTLTATYQLKTFADLVSAVTEELKIQATDTTAINRIKRDINIVYLEEVVPFSNWKWLRGVFDATVYASISAGTASVAQGSNTVTLTNAIGSPKDNWLFGIVGYSEVYRIAKHTANATTLSLQVPYTGATTTTGNYKIWTDEIYLPSFVRETFEVTHDFADQPLENCGLQKFRGYVAALPRAEGRPFFYTTNTYVDPVQYAVPAGIPAVSSRASNTITKTLTFASDVSNYLQQGDRIQIYGAADATYNVEGVVATQSGAVITYTAMVPTYEATTVDAGVIVLKLQPSSDTRRAKRLQVYPAIFTQNTTLHIDYLREALGMADLNDEPLMPIGDRTCLLYGALHRAWSRERNPEEAKRNYDLFNVKLGRMAGKMDDSIDQPRLIPDKIYLGAKRMAQRQKDNRNGLPEGWGGGGASGTNPIINTASRAAQFDSTGALGASLVTTAELARLSGILSSAVGISDTQTLTNKVLSGNTASSLVNGAGTFNLNPGGIITVPSATDTLVGKSTSDTLTNKILSGNTATNLISGSGTFTLNTSGTITAPNATDTLVAKATTDTLSNKTITGSANTILGLSNTNLSSSALITNGNLAQMSPGTIKGNNTASSATPLDLTSAQVAAMVASVITLPTVQTFLTGSGTYVKPALCRYMRTVAVGAGGGGGGSGTTPGNGGNGGDTTFGPFTFGGGKGGVGTGGEAGAGGTAASLGSSAFGISVGGGNGGTSVGGLAAFNEPGGVGAPSALGGGGTIVRGTGTGGPGTANTGGGGGGSVAATGGASGAGGGSGAFADIVFIPSVASTAFAYSIGTAGSSGTAGGSGFAGGVGGTGGLWITEFYT